MQAPEEADIPGATRWQRTRHLCKPGAIVIQQETAKVAGKGASGSNIKLSRPGLFVIDYVVDDGKDMMFTLITEAQFQQIEKGKKPTGAPLLKAIVPGSGTQSVKLKKGNYFFGINNYADADRTITYRASFVEGR